MNAKKRAFNVFNNEMPFLLPQPIPEPPRVINPKPMVPDVSLDISPINGFPLVDNQNNFMAEKWRTIYPSPQRPHPSVKSRSPPKPMVANNRQNIASNSPSNEVMFEMIRQQDIQLQRISEQIGELLKIHQISEKRPQIVNKCHNNKRSVQTMTSIVYPNDENISPLTHKPSNGLPKPTKRTSKTSTTPSTATKDLRALRLETISDCQTEDSNIELDSNRLNFSESPVRRSANTSSIEILRKNNGKESIDDHLYDRMVNNIEFMLNNSSDDTDADSGRRSSCSPTPPQSRRRQPEERRHRYELQTEQTLYIKRLAAKYLVDESVDNRTKLKAKQRVFATERTHDLNVYGMTKNASIATKNYLEKYGLTHSPPKVQKSPHFYENQNKNKFKLNRNKILDIDSLKRQQKYT